MVKSINKDNGKRQQQQAKANSLISLHNSHVIFYETKRPNVQFAMNIEVDAEAMDEYIRGKDQAALALFLYQPKDGSTTLFGNLSSDLSNTLQARLETSTIKWNDVKLYTPKNASKVVFWGYMTLTKQLLFNLVSSPTYYPRLFRKSENVYRLVAFLKVGKGHTLYGTVYIDNKSYPEK